jgi:hypothetical protein
MAGVADTFVGRARRSSPQYGLAYRSVDHRLLRQISDEVRRPALRDRYKPYGPPSGFGPEMIALAELLLDLQQKRYAADYDPIARFTAFEVRTSIGMARDALIYLRAVPDTERALFFGLLVFPPR